MKAISSFIAISLVALAVGCTSSSHVIIGEARAPIRAEEVKVFTTPPAQYERVALVSTSNKQTLPYSDQVMTPKAVTRLKQEAAELGANGVLIREARDIGSAGVGTEANFNPSNRNAHGEAIYVIQE